MLTEQKPESTGKLMYIENRIFNKKTALTFVCVILNLCHPERSRRTKDEG